MDSTLVIKNSHTYCKNLQVIKSQALRACSQGDRLVGKDHRSPPTATHKEDNQRNTSCFKFVAQRLPYVHATGLGNSNTSISQIHNYSTSMTLILPSSYLKQSSGIKLLIVFNALYMNVFIIPILDAHHIRTKFITKSNYHVVLKESQNNISEAWQFNNFYKIKPSSCSKKI